MERRINYKAEKLVKELIAVTTDALTQVSPADLFEELIYGNYTKEEVTTLIIFCCDMFAGSSRLKLIPEELVDYYRNKEGKPYDTYGRKGSN